MNPNDPVVKVVLDYADLADETTEAGQVCPACKGGTSEEGSLSVTRRGELLLYNCHRASCGFSGRVRADGTGSRIKLRPEEKDGRVSVTSTPLNPATTGFLAAKFGIGRETLDLAELRWTGEGRHNYGRRVGFPIVGPDSKRRGYSYRSYEGSTPKALIELTSKEQPALSWYKFLRKSDILVLVEDQVSAIKLAPHVHSCALLGTHLSEAKVHEIKEQGYRRIYLCLDPDAVFTAIKMQLALRHSLPNMYVLGIECDIKNMDKGQFDAFLNRLT